MTEQSSRASAAAGPVFQIGIFRSGTTLAWNILRKSGLFCSYCEPFHEHLLELVAGASDLIDPTHQGVTDYWEEYRRLDQNKLAKAYKSWFGRERFQIGPEEIAPDLEAYLRFLIESAPSRVALKLVRAGLRSGWLRATFPESTIIYVKRAPRDIWSSAVKWDSGATESNVGSDQRRGTFLRYFDLMARDVGLDIPGHPYRQFYALWRLCEQQTLAVADDTWVYEEMVTDFSEWARAHLIDTGLLPAIPAIEVRGASLDKQNHDQEWYDSQEADVEALLAAKEPRDSLHSMKRSASVRAFGGQTSAARWFAKSEDWWEGHYVEAVSEIRTFLAGDGISLTGRDIMDIGCGDGIISLGLANQLSPASVVGVDLEPVDQEFLQSLARANEVPGTSEVNLRFEVCQLDHIPLADSSIDVAVAWSVFEHVQDLPTLLSEIGRVLKTEGYLFCQVWPLFHSESGSHLWNWLEPFAHLSLSDGELRDHLREQEPDLATSMLGLYDSCSRVTLDQIGSALVDSGFFVAKVELISNGFHVPPELQHLPLSLIGISGFKLLAVNHHGVPA